MIDEEEIFSIPIGRAKALTEKGTISPNNKGGSASFLSYNISWEERDSTSANITFFLNEQQVWTSAPAGLSLDSLISFLKLLTRAWPWLLIEKNYPLGVTPRSPSLLLHKLESVCSPRYAREQTNIFEAHHNIAKFFIGLQSTASLYMVREGGYMLIEAGNTTLACPHGDVVRTLSSLGNKIIAKYDEHIADSVKYLWSNRGADESLSSEIDALSMGVSENIVINLYERKVIKSENASLRALRGDDPVRAAARMLIHKISIDELTQVSHLIEAQAYNKTEELDVLASEAISILWGTENDLPRAQGKLVAQWFRERLKQDQDKAVDVKSILHSFNVNTVVFEASKLIEAVSFWGKEHGPTILLNKNGRRNASHLTDFKRTFSGGSRFTLAHELCHLLLDRNGALPIADVLGGSVSPNIEERANSFAAEFLLPEEAAGLIYQRSTSIKEAIELMMRGYEVTKTLVAWQLLKRFDESSSTLTQSDRGYLANHVRRG